MSILQTARGEVPDPEDPSDDVGLVGALGLRLIQSIIFVYDFVTYPLYYAVQQPWYKREAAQQIRSFPVHQTDTEVTYRPPAKMCKELRMFIDAGIDTMEKCFAFAVELHSHKRMLGTRKVLEETDEVQPDGKVFKKWRMGEYQWRSYVQVDVDSTNFGKGLRELGLKPKQNICIFAETKAEWLTAAIGCFKQTFPLVTLYANLGTDAIVHGVNETEVSIVITTHDLLPKFKEVLERTPLVKILIFMEDQIQPTVREGYRSDVRILSFTEVLELGKPSTAVATKPTLMDPAIIMYTSGSTGTPKGVILPHESLVTTVKAFHFVVNPPIRGDIYLGYLPLAHILELLSEMTMIVQGIPVGYSSPNTMIDTSTKVMKGTQGDCSVLKPSLMCAVPLVIDRIYKGIHEKINKKGPFMRKFMEFCYQYKSYYRQLGMNTPIMNYLIFRKMRALVGGRIRLLLSGGAPLSPETHDYVRNALDLPLVQGYGLTESCACGTIMDSDEMSTGRVGPPLQGVEIKLLNWEEGGYKVTDKPYPRGEIVVGGGNVATGYYMLPEKTGEDFSTDSTGKRWFRTGDIGTIESDGTLRIIDRKKDLVKLQFGEYVSLGKVESQLKTCPLVDNVCVYGDSTKSYCVALVVPNRAKLEEIAANLNLSDKSFEEMCKDKDITKAILKELTKHGQKVGLQRFELPGAITLCTENWDPDSGLVTAAFKLKRKPIQEKYQRDLSRMYGARCA